MFAPASCRRARPGAGIYNAACYRALHGQLDEARELLREAFQLDPELVAWSKQDDDLIAMRDELDELASERGPHECRNVPVRTVIDRGPKGKRAVAFALDWPGWSRGAKTSEVAVETLESYRERYRPIAALAGMADEFDAAGPLEIVEEKVGTRSVDFWGISFSPSSTELDPMDEAELERGITLLRACWAFFDAVAARVSPEMRKGPRGGGRERDEIIRHVFRVESLDFAKQVGLQLPDGPILSGEALRRYREDYVAGIRAYNAGQIEKRMRSWNLPFLIRHSAFHTLDHAWEMEDKDLSVEGPA